jgi:gamma-butyrobetaine dioxygenase
MAQHAAPAVTVADIPEGGAGRAVSVEWSTGERASFNVLWLRDNCPTGGDKRSAFRTFSVADLDPDLVLAKATASAGGDLAVTFSDGHRSVFDAAWLHHNRPGRAPGRPTTWRSDAELTTIEAGAVSEVDGWHRLLEAVARDGAALVNGVPPTPEGSAALAARLGHVRETDFGRFFDIISEPEVWTMSQSTSAMDPHTDDPYRYTPSGISVLHCIEASPTGGGRSTLVDGFAVAEAIREERPEAFELLRSVAVPWVRHRTKSVDQGAAVHLVAHAPVIAVDRHGGLCGIRFHERSMGSLDIDPDLTHGYYRALIEFTSRIRSPAFQWEHGLAPGEAIVFDNQRVLHGRTGFDGDPGRRHLRLCTVDRDQVHSTLRLLRAELDPDREHDELPSGNLS